MFSAAKLKMKSLLDTRGNIFVIKCRYLRVKSTEHISTAFDLREVYVRQKNHAHRRDK